MCNKFKNGDLVMQYVHEGRFDYGIVLFCHSNGALDVIDIKNRVIYGWSSRFCDKVSGYHFDSNELIKIKKNNKKMAQKHHVVFNNKHSKYEIKKRVFWFFWKSINEQYTSELHALIRAFELDNNL